MLVSIKLADFRLGYAVFCSKRCSDISSSKLAPSSLCCLSLAKTGRFIALGPTSDPVVLGPLSDLAPIFLLLIIEFMAVPIRSDYLSDLSEMGCRDMLSFLLLTSF